MAEVTGFTAERMLTIEEQTIVDGMIQGDDLILVTREGTQINAGDVRGPIGPVGPVAGAIGDIGDVMIDAAVNGDIMQLDNGMWIPRTPNWAQLDQTNEIENHPMVFNREIGIDASLDPNSGVIQIGLDDVRNMLINNNEIMVRDGQGGSATMFLQADGGNIQIGGPNAPADVDTVIDMISKGSLTLNMVADDDNVDENDTVTLKLSQDGGVVWAEAKIDSSNKFRLTTSYDHGGPFMEWKYFANGINTNGIPGCDLGSQACYRCGNIGMIYATVAISKTIAGGPNGDTGNTTVANLSSAFQGDGPSGQALGSSTVGPGIFVHANPSSGSIRVTATLPNNDLNGNTISFSGMILIEI